ncbi:MAG: immunoglobulin domain-containing protein [Limisphaerales bacterium]
MNPQGYFHSRRISCWALVLAALLCLSLQNLADVAAGGALYQNYCKGCHNPQGQLDPPLEGASKFRLKTYASYSVMVNAFKNFSDTDYNNMAAFLASKDPGAYGVSGNVKTTNNTAFANVQISITSEYNNGASTTTDANGNYQVTGLKAGDYTVTPVNASFVFVPKRLVILDFVNLFPGNNEPPQSTFDQNGLVTSVNFTAQPPIAVSGFVKTRLGAALQGVTVSVSGRTAITDNSGHYALTNLFPATYTVTATAPGLVFSSTNATVAVSGPVEVDFLGGPPIVYVSTTGNNANDGTSWAKAKATVQAGADAGFLDVWVAKGTYVENISLQAGILLYGGFAGTESARNQRNPLQNETILDGGHLNRVVDMKSLFDNGATTTVIDGFTITNGVNQGAGIRISDSGQTVSNNRISGNQTSGTGGGIWVSAGSPLIVGNTITGNSASSGGGAIYCDGAPAILSNVIEANTTAAQGGGVYIRNGSVVGNLIVNNAAGDGGGGVYCSFGTALIANNTIVGNTNNATFGGGIQSAFGGTPEIVNNIVAFNSSGIANAGAGTPTLENNCVFGNPGFNYSGLTAGSGDISSDPKLVDVAGGNYHLLPASPCVDVGNDAVVQLGALDIDGQPRIQGPHVDIGADELKTDFAAPVLTNGKADPYIVGTGGGTPTISVTASDNVGVLSASAQIIVSGTSTQTVVLTLTSGNATSGTWQGTFVVPANNSGQAATYQIVFSAKDQAANEGLSAETDVTQSVLSGTLAIVRVSVNGDDNNDGSSWAKAKRTVSAGINQSLQEIWTAKGTYVENVSLLPGLGLYGGFAGTETARDQRNPVLNETILDGGGGRVVDMVSAYDNGATKSVIDGFTITNGGNQGAGLEVRDTGQTVSNNRIIGNHAGGFGGGIWVAGGSPLIVDNTITGNTSYEGGAIYCNGTPTILNNVISYNTSSGKGGGISIGEGTLVGNIIVNNRATTGGGGVFCWYGSALIANNTIAGNSNKTAVGGGIHCEFGAKPAIANNIVALNSSGIANGGAGTPTLQNNCVFANAKYDYSGLTAGSGDVAADPQFVDPGAGDYHLLPTSACINAGNDAVVQPGAVDIDGEPRIQGAHVDIGADESNPNQPASGKAPHIQSQPGDQIVPIGSPAGFSVEAAGTLPLSYQWRKGGTAINGATSSSFTVASSAQLSDAGDYFVVIGNSYGSVTSEVAVLTVVVTPSLSTNLALITFDDLPEPAFGGTMVPDNYQGLHWNFLYGNGLTNEFYPSGLAAAVISSSNVAFGGTSITSAVPFHLVSGYLTAVLNDGLQVEVTGFLAGNVISDTNFIANATNHTLIDLSSWPPVDRVDFTATGGTEHYQPLGAGGIALDNLAITYPPPHIDTQPQGATVVEGLSAALSVTVSGQGPFTYQWRKDGVMINGATAASLDIPVVQASDAGEYSVVVSSPYGIVSSAVAVLAVATKQTVITFDELPEAAPGGTALPEGYYGFHWDKFFYVNGLTNEFNPSGFTAAVISSSNVVFNNSFDGTVSLTSAVPFHVVSTYMTAEWNDDVQVEVTGSLGGNPVNDSTFVINPTNATFVDLSLWGAVDRVDFTATGGTNHFLVLGTGSFALDNVAVILPPPHIDQQPINQTVPAGNTAFFSVTASGAPTITYQWRKDGVNIGGATDASLMIANVQASDAAGYSVVVANAYGMVTSAVAVLTIGTGGGGGGQPSNDSCGGTVVIATDSYTNTQSTLNATATGDVVPSCSNAASFNAVWYAYTPSAPGQLVVDTVGSDFDTLLAVYTGTCNALSEVGCDDNSGGNQTSKLTIPVVAGTTYYIAAGGVGGNKGNLVIHVNYGVPAPPDITNQPQSLAVVAGANVTFGVSATGTAPLSYQWQFKGTNVPGATGTNLVLNTVATSQAGNYDVVVTNPGGSATSSNAVLTVTKANAAVTLANLTRAYDRTAKTASAATTPPGLAVSLTYNGNATAPVAAGNYVVVGTVNDPNYAGSATNTLTIAHAPVTVSGLTANNKTYDGTTSATLAGTAALNGVISPDTVTLGGTASGAFASKTIGTAKPVTVTGLTLSGADAGNYTLTQPSLSANISAAALTVTADNASRVFGTANPIFTGTIVGIQNNDNITATYTSSATAASTVGTYAIVPALVDPDGNVPNYNVTLNNGQLTITNLTGTLNGVAIDGYVQGGTVFLDANHNRVRDGNEPSTQTDQRGQFQLAVDITLFDTNHNGRLEPSEGSLVITGGVDIATLLPMTIPLTAPPDSSVINPLTSLLVSMVDANPGLTLSNAEANVKSVLAIPSAIALGNYDPLAAAATNDPRSGTVLAAAAKVQDTIAAVTSLLKGASTNDPAQIANLVSRVLANQALTNNSFGLSVSNFVQAVIDQSAAAAGITLNASVKQGAAQIIAQANQAADNLVPGGQTGLVLAHSLTQVEGVAQGQIAVALQNVAAGKEPIADAVMSFTGTTLLNSITNQPVGDLTGTGTPAQPRLAGKIVSGGQFQLTFTSEVGRTYVVQTSTDLLHWADLPPLTATSNTLQFIDSTMATASNRFYRVRVP